MESIPFIVTLLTLHYQSADGASFLGILVPDGRNGDTNWQLMFPDVTEHQLSFQFPIPEDSVKFIEQEGADDVDIVAPTTQASNDTWDEAATEHISAEVMSTDVLPCGSNNVSIETLMIDEIVLQQKRTIRVVHEFMHQYVSSGKY